MRRYISDKPTVALSRYKPRPGDCDGGDIGGVPGVTTADACAEKCDDVAECVGFVYVTSQQTKCYLKMALCVDTYTKDGATMYDGVGQSRHEFIKHIYIHHVTCSHMLPIPRANTNRYKNP